VAEQRARAHAGATRARALLRECGPDGKAGAPVVRESGGALQEVDLDSNSMAEAARCYWRPPAHARVKEFEQALKVAR
jgi:hypothetical protein